MTSHLDNFPTAMVLDQTTEKTDMVVIVGDSRIPCHQAIVCYYSCVIKTAMESNFKEGQTNEFTFTDPCANVDNVRQFLLAMYNPWSVKEMDKHVHDIYRLSHVYQVPKLLKTAGDAFARLLSDSNFWATATTYNGNADPDIIGSCAAFLKTQSKSTIDTIMEETNAEYVAAMKCSPSIVGQMMHVAFRRYQQAAPSTCTRIGFHASYSDQPLSDYVIACKFCTKQRLSDGHPFETMFPKIHNVNEFLK